MSATSNRHRILLVGWDGADWNHLKPLLARGQLPALQGLMERGAWGNLATLQPMVSPMLWTSIATGRTADQHGVLAFVEPAENNDGMRPWSSLSRRCKAVWNILQQHGWRSSVVGWWASHPAEPLNGVVVANTIINSVPDGHGGWHAPEGSIHPPERTAEFAALNMLPSELTEAHILPFVPRAAEVDQDRDRRLSAIGSVLANCVSIQSITTRIMETEPWDFLAVYFEGIDHFCHGFMPYYPPKLPHIREREYELYRDVVDGAYRFHDMMLERLLDLAGPETTVLLCSDHGFLSGPDRPEASPNDPAGPTLWHRDMGILVMSGPGIKEGARIRGASLLDITPTLLSLCGLPVAENMPGKPLTEVLTDPGPAQRIPSWDDVPGPDGRHPQGADYGAARGDAALTKQLVALGYVEDTGGDNARAAQASGLEADFNLAQVYLSIGEPATAVPLLERLLRIRPWETRYVHQLANACVRAGWHAHAVELLRCAYPENESTPPPAVFLLMARACIGMGASKDAAWYAGRAARAMPVLAGSCVELGNVLLTLDDYSAAELAFRRALGIDPAIASAWEGLAGVYLRTGENERALEAGLEAVELVFQTAEAHLNIGIALTRLGRFAEARTAFHHVTVMRPRQPHAWRFLAALPESGNGGDFVREACRQQAHRLSRTWAASRKDVRARARELRPLPEIPPPATRRARDTAERPGGDLFAVEGPVGRTFTLVSGLPRSGTSLMMQMLEAGGLPPLTDGLRPADDDNPAGYYEWELIKSVARRPALFDADGLEGFAIKCISALLPSLPAKHRYRVIFMSRPVEEVVRSQEQMKMRRGTATQGPSEESLAAALTKHRGDILNFIRIRPRAFDFMLVDYPSLVANPTPWISRIAAFLGPGVLPHPERMTAVIRPALHRRKGSAPEPEPKGSDGS